MADSRRIERDDESPDHAAETSRSGRTQRERLKVAKQSLQSYELLHEVFEQMLKNVDALEQAQAVNSKELGEMRESINELMGEILDLEDPLDTADHTLQDNTARSQEDSPAERMGSAQKDERLNQLAKENEDLHRQLAKKVKVDRDAQEQLDKINKQLGKMQILIGDPGCSGVDKKGTVKEDAMDLDD